ncbi:putative set domain-containing protein [Phaeomoniella chlamydospora]|uniref:Putative set domain-containing protein n=1 Tax=Phaeomoniella chlamydospora TaxID=158046 RepID=A0A0G2HFK8_PHACM|nr:putative set domain-containing protein [Phaeomoniella chlamydospora]
MPSSTTLPKSWPRGVTYLLKPQYGRYVNQDQLISVLDSSTSVPTTTTITGTKASSGPCPLVKVTKIQDKTHPAFDEFGLFANRHLPPDTFILFYLGFVHGTEDVDETSNYDLSLDAQQGIGIDATKMGNEARFINDYRGIRDAGPNAEFRDCWVDVGGGRREKRIGVYVLSAGKSGKRANGIGKGEEILVSYGKGFWSHRVQS